MLNTLLEETASRGDGDVLLEVRADTPRAQVPYLRHGFEQIHTPRLLPRGASMHSSCAGPFRRLQVPGHDVSITPREAS
jgi:hypothetical protein